MKNKNVFWIMVLGCFSLSFSGSFSFTLQPDEAVNVRVYEKCNAGVVNITAVALKRDFFFDIVPQRGQGSGVIFDHDGYIVTNDHVIGDAQHVEVILADKTSFPAKVIGVDPDTDLAVIKIDPKGKKFTTIEWGVGTQLKVGQTAYAIGNPFGLGGSMAKGMISSLGREIFGGNDRKIKDVVQTDAAINPGNSGGPLIDSAGRLIGINTQIVSRGGGSDGIGFAISVDTVKRVATQLVQYGRVLRVELGVEGLSFPAFLLKALKYPLQKGVMVTGVEPGSLADKAGFKAADQEAILGFHSIPIGGDVIFQVDAQPVSHLRDLLDYVADKKAGDIVRVHYYRGKKKKSVQVKLTLPAAIPKDSKVKSL